MVRFMIVVFARGDGIEIRTHRAGPRGKLSSSKDAVTSFLRRVMRTALGRWNFLERQVKHTGICSVE